MKCISWLLLAMQYLSRKRHIAEKSRMNRKDSVKRETRRYLEKFLDEGNIVQKSINSTIEQGVSDETARIDSHSVISAHCAKGFAITVIKTGRADEFAL
jgi:hypothetical protein